MRQWCPVRSFIARRIAVCRDVWNRLVHLEHRVVATVDVTSKEDAESQDCRYQHWSSSVNGADVVARRIGKDCAECHHGHRGDCQRNSDSGGAKPTGRVGLHLENHGGA